MEQLRGTASALDRPRGHSLRGLRGANHRIDAVGDAWLDAGIVPFSTLGYLENSDAFENWYPADFITEMREQIRLWFYSMLFMSVTIQNRSPYQSVFVYEKLNDEPAAPCTRAGATRSTSARRPTAWART